MPFNENKCEIACRSIHIWLKSVLRWAADRSPCFKMDITRRPRHASRGKQWMPSISIVLSSIVRIQNNGGIVRDSRSRAPKLGWWICCCSNSIESAARLGLTGSARKPLIPSDVQTGISVFGLILELAAVLLENHPFKWKERPKSFAAIHHGYQGGHGRNTRGPCCFCFCSQTLKRSFAY